MIPLTERSHSKRVNNENELRQREINLRVAAPGIIQSFNSAELFVPLQTYFQPVGLPFVKKEIMMAWRRGKIFRSL